MAKNKKKKIENPNAKYQVTDYIIYLYLIAMFSVYLVIFTNKYFNMTITRYTTFMICSLSFVGMILIAYLVKFIMYMVKTAKRKEFDSSFMSTKKQKAVAWPEFWIELYLMANIFSLLMASNVENSLTGIQGRRMGLYTIIVLTFVMITIGARFKANTLIYMVLAGATIWAHIVALLQIVGIDFMHLRDKLSKKSANVFISTFGNINIYASFITISMPVFICIFIFSKKIIYRLVAGYVTALSGMALMMSNSDSAYLGVGVSLILIFMLAYKDDKLPSFFGTVCLILIGNLAMVILNINGFAKYKKRGGFADLFNNLKLTLILLAVALVLTIASYRVYKYFGEELKNVNKKKNIIIMLALMLAGICAICVVGVVSKSTMFKFNDKWGNYRGYIWRISTEIYADFPLECKIFGNGVESVRELTVSGYGEEMVKVTHSTYDNCHNEILQNLLTTGLIGAISYVGIFLSSIIYILKNSKKDYLAYIPAAAMLGYFAQAMVGLSQPITSPLYYVFIGIGIGYVRYLAKVEVANDKLSS